MQSKTLMTIKDLSLKTTVDGECGLDYFHKMVVHRRGHWWLLPVLPKCRTVYVLDSTYEQSKRKPESYRIKSVLDTVRPEEWVPPEVSPCKNGNNVLSPHYDADRDKEIADIFSIHEGNESSPTYQYLPLSDPESSNKHFDGPDIYVEPDIVSVWKQQFVDALVMERTKLRESNNSVWWGRVFWHVLIASWRLLFAFVPPYQIAHGWIAFICSLCFISGITYIVTMLTHLMSCVTGINGYVIAFTTLASGTSWPDLVASKIAAERQTTANSAIANITCSNSVNIYVGIGVPWVIDTAYNLIAYGEPLHNENARGLSFSLLVFFSTSVGCIQVLVLRRIVFGGELGGPRVWAWITCAYFMMLWVIFVVLSSLKVSGIISTNLIRQIMPCPQLFFLGRLLLPVICCCSYIFCPIKSILEAISNFFFFFFATRDSRHKVHL